MFFGPRGVGGSGARLSDLPESLRPAGLTGVFARSRFLPLRVAIAA